MVNPFTAIENDADNTTPIDQDEIIASKTRRVKSVYVNPESDSTSKYSNKDANAQSKSLHSM